MVGNEAVSLASRYVFVLSCSASEKARADLQERELVIDLKYLTAISYGLLIELMNERVNFRCGVFTRQVLRQLTRRTEKP